MRGTCHIYSRLASILTLCLGFQKSSMYEYVSVDSNETVFDFSEVISSGFAASNRCACHYNQRDRPMIER
jgi:hypothetical protein